MHHSLLPLRWAAVVLAGVLAATPVLAKDDHGGGKHGHKADKHADKDHRKAEKHAEKEERKAIRNGAYFEDRHRDSVRYYYTSYSGKHCPPGLAKKHNGCMPRGHARWEVGHRLPPTVAVYTVPQPILVTLPPPPPQHRYVRVAGDILLIAIGTQMVVDGIHGLNN